MGYRLEPSLPVTRSVREAALSELDSARSWLAENDIHTEIHNARKGLKRLRSLIRLVHPGIPKPLSNYLGTGLRDIGRELAPARDAQVLLEILDKLAQRSPKLAASEMFGKMQGRLERRRATVEVEGAAIIEKARQDLDRLRPTLARLAVFPDDFEPLREGAEKQYRAAQKGFSGAFKSSSDEALHDWRKQVQRHWRQLQLLAPCCPESLNARADRVHRLAKLLGDHQDLADLKQLVAAPTMNFGRAEEIQTLTKRCRKDQKALRAEAKSLGARLFADKPESFIARIESWWKDASKVAAPAEQWPWSGEPRPVQDTNVLSFDDGRRPESKTG